MPITSNTSDGNDIGNDSDDSSGSESSAAFQSSGYESDGDLKAELAKAQGQKGGKKFAQRIQSEVRSQEFSYSPYLQAIWLACHHPRRQCQELKFERKDD